MEAAAEVRCSPGRPRGRSIAGIRQRAESSRIPTRPFVEASAGELSLHQGERKSLKVN